MALHRVRLTFLARFDCRCQRTSEALYLSFNIDALEGVLNAESSGGVETSTAKKPKRGSTGRSTAWAAGTGFGGVHEHGLESYVAQRDKAKQHEVWFTLCFVLTRPHISLPVGETFAGTLSALCGCLSNLWRAQARHDRMAASILERLLSVFKVTASTSTFRSKVKCLSSTIAELLAVLAGPAWPEQAKVRSRAAAGARRDIRVWPRSVLGKASSKEQDTSSASLLGLLQALSAQAEVFIKLEQATSGGEGEVRVTQPIFCRRPSRKSISAILTMAGFGLAIIFERSLVEYVVYYIILKGWCISISNHLALLSLSHAAPITQARALGMALDIRMTLEDVTSSLNKNRWKDSNQTSAPSSDAQDVRTKIDPPAVLTEGTASPSREQSFKSVMQPLQFEMRPIVDLSHFKSSAASNSGTQAGGGGGGHAFERNRRILKEVSSLATSLPLHMDSSVHMVVDESRSDVMRSVVCSQAVLSGGCHANINTLFGFVWHE
eukprot:scaffold7274_cov52-Prasinocladus_malaysianus.AAC.1